MDPASIREFAARRWDLVADQKRRVRIDRYVTGGAQACFEVLVDLRARFDRAHPGGYSEQSRRLDLVHHLQLARKLRRIQDGCAKR